MKKISLALSLALVAAVLGSFPASARDPFAEAKKALKDVPCNAPSVTETETSKNLKVLSKLPWPAVDMSGGEIDIQGNVLISFYRESLGYGLLVFDISDPTEPILASKIETGPNTPYDAKLTSDGKTAIVGIGGVFAASNALGLAGVVAVDVSDPYKPKITDEWISTRPGPLQNGHMVFTEKIGGEHWVWIAPNEGSGAWSLRLEGPASKRKFVYVGQTFPVEGGPLGPHDIFVQKDKLLKKWVLYAADGYHGWLAFDVSDPAAPVPLGGFTHPSTGYTHSIQAAIVDGRRIVVTTEEVGVNLMKVYDATDLLLPTPIGYWYSESGSPAASQHNFQIVGHNMYEAHYSEGMYAFDLRDLAERTAADFGPITPVGHLVDPDAVFWDVVVGKGLLYLTDYTTGGGLQVAGFGCMTPGDPRLTSTG